MSQIRYEVIEDLSALPQEVQQGLQGKQQSEGLTVVEAEGATYALLSLGERPTGGYTIEVQQVIESAGRIEIHAKVKEPAAGLSVIQMITYPALVVKLPETGKPVEWKQK
ncbi:protease complex subunit PrcB family protein [Tumebacillus sp. DT12]|uniref:Protease complex subunit PrcB family protein n=1 Tax=Tumebacillus lacus TaxID=2995335 RepID=A0ABT3X251_9BACL|nr:protease complex subunit PrcB family protein [Tumebacillus lacus]MCX7570023.1 protease complex subunit PrcB family protein [Tumebacillus lacus]